MKILKLFKKLGFLILLLSFVSSVAFAQQVYVDATNGNDGTGDGSVSAPYASIAMGLSQLPAAGGTLVLKAGTYNGAGLATPNLDVVIAKGQTIDGHTQPNWDDNATITIRLERLANNSNDEVKIVDTGGEFTFNIKGGTLNIVSNSGTEYLNLAGTDNFILGSSTNSVTVNIATLNAGGGAVTVKDGATLVLHGTSSFSNEAPKETNDINVQYLDGGNQTAGAEAKYGDFGTGTILVNKTNNTDLVTFPNTAITAIGGITITKGSVTFQNDVTVDGNVSLAAGGNANFTNLNMKKYDLTNSGTGTLAISGNLDFAVADGTPAAANLLGQLFVSGGGAVTVDGTTQWSESITAAKDYSSIYAINLSNGNVTLSGVTLTNDNGDGTNNGIDYTLTFYNNDANGNLTVGTVTTNSTASANKGYGILNVTNQNTGTTSVAGSIRGSVTNTTTGTLNITGATTITKDLNNASTGTVNVNGATTVAGVFTNAGTTDLGANTLTLSGNSPHLTNGGTVKATTGGIIVSAAGASSFNGGTLSNVTVSGTGTNTISGAASLTDLTISAGAVNMSAAVTGSGNTTISGGTLILTAVTYKTTNFTQSAGTVTLTNDASSILDVKGNFSRVSGTFTAGAASLVKLSGTAAQSFDGGHNFQLSNLTVSNTGGTVTLANTVRASGTVTVNTGAIVELGNLNIVFNATTGKMVNNGTIQTTGNTNGAIIFGGADFVTGGNNVDGMILNASSSAVFSNIIIDVGSAYDVITTGTAGNIRWTKELYLYSGDLNNTAAVDIAPSGTNASIKRNLSKSANGIVLTTGTFNNAAVDYNLTYTGTLTGNKTINTTTAVEWDKNNVVNLTISAGGASGAVVLAGDKDRALKGNLTLTGNSTASNASRLTGDKGNLTVTGNLNVGENSVLTLANNTGSDLTIDGVLTISKDGEISQGNSSSLISLAGDNQTHSILGRITAASVLTVDGTGVTINGQPASTDVDASELANLTVAASKSVTVYQIHEINGNVETKTDAALTLGLTQPSTSPADKTDGNGIITGTLTLGGSSFTMTSNLEIQNGIVHNKGSFAFDTYNATLTTGGTYTRAADASAVYTSNGGALVSNYSATYNFNGGTIPYWDVKVAITLAASSDVTVSKKLDIQTGGSIANGGADITIPTLLTTVGGNVVTGPGKVIFTGTKWIASGANPTISNVEINSTGTTTFETSDLTTPAYRTFIVTGVLTQKAGDLAIGNNDLKLTGTIGDAYVRTAGNITANDGQFIFGGTGDQTFNPGTGWKVTNLTIDNSASTGTEVTTNDNKTFTVTGTLDLVDGVLQTLNTSNASTDGLLHIGNGAVVKRDASKSLLNEVPVFDGSVDVWYITGGGTTGKELPTSTTALNDLHVDVATTLNAATTVNGTLYLNANVFTTTSPKIITMANGSTIERVAGTMSVAPSVTSYNLVYKNTAVTTTDNELVANKVANLTLNGSKDVKLNASVTMSGNLVLNTAANLDLNGKNLTTSGDVTITKGGITNGATSLSQFTFNGAAAQTFTVPAAGLVFPNTSAVKGVELVLNNTSTAGVTLLGGNLTMQNTNPAKNVNIVRFINGVLKTGTNVVTLWQSSDATTNVPLQGFDRSGVTTGKYSHIVGNVKKFINNGNPVAYSRVDFPTGTASGDYRPASFFFTTKPQSSFNLTVSHDTTKAGGTNGFPIASGSIQITNYPDFYWKVTSDQTLAPSYKYDLELQAQNYPDYKTDGIQNIRMIRRAVGNSNNQWVLQGADGNYQNQTVTTNWPLVKVIDATGGITSQGADFTLGQNNKPPVFTAALPDTTIISEGDTLSFTYAANDPDINQTATMSAVTLPTGATFDTSTGKFVWATNYYSAGTYTVKIQATDGYQPVDTTSVIVVKNVNQPPQFTAAPSDTTNIAEGATYTFTYKATDPDTDNTSLTYSYVPTTPAPDSVLVDSTTGLLTIVPAFGEAGNYYNITVRVTDSDNGATDTTVVFHVTKTNRPPVIARAVFGAKDTLKIDEGATGTVKYTATDPDGNTLTYSVAASNGDSTGAKMVDSVFTWTPDYTQAGLYTFYVKVTDNGTPPMSDTDTLVVKVNFKNAPPTFVNVLKDTTVFVGDTLNFTYKATDLNKDVLTYAFVGNHPSDATLNSTTGAFSWAPTTALQFPALIKVSVTDGTDTVTTQAAVTIKTTTVTISGVVTYANAKNDPIANAEVDLMQGTTKVATDSTNSSGAYSFSGVAAGTYSVVVSKTKDWPANAVLASDALLAARSSVDTTVKLTSMQKLAADVTGDGVVNSFDALQILQRVVKIINKFAVSDWQFESNNAVKVGTKNVTLNVKGIAAGDVNESYDAATMAKANMVTTETGNTIKIRPNAEFALPITLDASQSVGAFTLRLSYPASKMEFKEVKSNSVKVLSNVENGKISIAWANLNGKEAFKTNGKPVVTLIFKATKAFQKSETEGLTLNLAEVVNQMGKKISDASVKLSNAEIAIPKNFALSQNYPNPFNPATIIEYSLPIKGNVKLTIYNSLGQRVVTLVNKVQEAGNYKARWNAANLSSGIYFYNITVEGVKNFVQTKKMILLK